MEGNISEGRYDYDDCSNLYWEERTSCNHTYTTKCTLCSKVISVENDSVTTGIKFSSKGAVCFAFCSCGCNAGTNVAHADLNIDDICDNCKERAY